MSKHTPGPWRHEYEFKPIVDSDTPQETSVFQVWTENSKRTGSGIEHIAFCKYARDAALIAAAPELLDALLETLSCIDQHTDDPVIGPIIESAMLAIAKARGE